MGTKLGAWVGTLETEADTHVCGRLWSLMKGKVGWGECCESQGRGTTQSWGLHENEGAPVSEAVV